MKTGTWPGSCQQRAAPGGDTAAGGAAGAAAGRAGREVPGVRRAAVQLPLPVLRAQPLG